MIRFIPALLLGIMISSDLIAQTDPIQDVIRNKESELEEATSRAEQEQEDYTAFDALEEFGKSPFLINEASDGELRSFPLFSEQQCDAILRHRMRFGNFISIEELQLMPEFDIETIRQLKPFLRIEAKTGQQKITARNLLTTGDHTIMIRMQKKLSGTDEEDSYDGGSEKIYLRYKYVMSDRIRLGLTAEKDPGERLFSGENPAGFDFYSGHLMIRSSSLIRQITIGDYSVQSGQGLVMWAGLASGKSSEAIMIRKNASGIKPYTSADENNYLRGTALSLGKGSWHGDIFLSHHAKDANVTKQEGVESFSSFQNSGYHRTESELKNKKSVRETIAGINVLRQIHNLRLGSIVYFTGFSSPMEKKTEPYNQFEFSGKRNINYGLNASYLYKNLNAFAEAGMSSSKGKAFLGGMIIHLHPKLSYAFLWRSYDRHYHALQSAAFSENTRNANERGIFSALEYKLNKNLRLSVYADRFTFPWLRYQVNAPSSGTEYLMKLTWKPMRTFESYIQYRSKIKPANSDDSDSGLRTVEEINHNGIRWNIRIKLSDTWTWGSRIEKSFHKSERSPFQEGMMIFQDLIFHPMNSRISCGLRYAIFGTDSYDTRIYTYENDVLFSYSVPAMQGNGARMYANLRLKLARRMDIWLRYSITSFSKSPTETSADYKKPIKELKFQVRYRF